MCMCSWRALMHCLLSDSDSRYALKGNTANFLNGAESRLFDKIVHKLYRGQLCARYKVIFQIHK